MPALHAATGLRLVLLLLPSAANAASPSAANTVAEPVFSATRGFYTSAQLVRLTTATPGATIRFTTNGTPPSSTIGTVYTGQPVRVGRTMPLRAIAYKTGLSPSKVVTHTYIFVADVITQSSATTRSVYGLPANWRGTTPDYGMDPRVANLHRATIQNDLKTVPSLSIAMKTEDLFGSTGIYANPRSSGVAWERPTSLELLDPANPDGSRDLQVDCGIRIHGGAFRSFGLTKKKSFRVIFKSLYGPGKLRYPMFGPDAPQEFNTLVFRMESNDGYQWGNRTDVQYARDEFVRRTQRAMGSPASHGRHMHLYLNGVYWGIYNVVERPDDSFGESYFGSRTDDWDGVNSGKATNNGNLTSWNTLKGIVRRLASAGTEAARTAIYMEAQGKKADGSPDPQKADFIDVDNYIDYLLVNWYTGNADWPHKNYYHGRERDLLDAAPNRGTRTSHGTFFFCWDSEWSLFLRSRNDSTGQYRGVAEPYSHLRRSLEFRVRFGDRAHRALFDGGPLTPKPCLDRYAEVTKDHRSILIPELARWGDQHGNLRTVQQWSTQYTRIRNAWLAVRAPALVTILQRAGLYPNVTAPTFSLPRGKIPPGATVQITAPKGQIYYTVDDTDPRAIGGAVASGAKLYSKALRLDASTTLKARVRDGATWSALHEARYRIGSITINEILAKNDTGIRDNTGEREDWIELYNSNAKPVDVGGLYLAQDPFSRKRWRIPANQVIPTRSTLLIWADGDTHQGPLHAPFKLDADGEAVLLYDTDGTLLDRLTFGPQVADISTGALHDAQPHRVTFPVPTPRQPNSLPVCGWRRYSSKLHVDQTLGLTLTGTPGLGKSIALHTSGGPTSGHRALIVAVAAAELPFVNTSEKLLVAPQFVLLGVQPTSVSGVTSFPMTVPNLPALPGQVVYLQGWGLGAGPWTGSTGVVLKVCR